MNRRDFIGRAALLGVGGGALGSLPSTVAGTAALRAAAVGSDGPEWDAVRGEFDLDPGVIHLAGLLLASHPTPVRRAIERHRRGLDADPVRYWEEWRTRGESAARRAAAAYLGGSASEYALTDSTTMGLAMVYNGMDLRPGDEIVTTTHDHSATHRSLEFKAARSGASLRRVALYADPAGATAEEIVSNLTRAIGPRTRLVAVTYVHSSTGVKLPVRALADAIGGRALLAVDGVHGFGIEDVTVEGLGCDFFIAGCHKWLFGPRGTGIVWGRPSAQGRVTPTIPSFTAADGWGGTMTPGGFHSFEHRWALTEAFEFHRTLGKARVQGRIHTLARRCREGLAAMPHVTLHTPLAPELSSGIVCFDVRGRTPRQVVTELRARRIIASTTPYATSYARLTPGLLNTPEEVDRALAEIGKMA
jgi:isopenicillin-N epimerase